MKILLLVVVVLVAVFAVLMLVGVLLGRARVGPFRFGSGDRDEIERAAAEDVAAVRESDRYFRKDAPGRDPDDL